jgi:BirA family biotin operon repressor/biotin-[acetyl-CoA-carboxylase] ligase
MVPSEQLPPDLAVAFNAHRARFAPLAGLVHFYRTIGSTNDAASALAAAGHREGAVVVAEQQTAGRGRRGRTWFSPPGSGLYVSTLLDPSRAATDVSRAVALLTLSAGVALVEGVEAATGLRPELKWPNDLAVQRRKLAGILAETTAPTSGSAAGGASGPIVLGYGINVSTSAFPPELAARATSLETELGRSVDRAAVLVETLAALARRYADLVEGRYDAILDAWRASAPAVSGAAVSWETHAGRLNGTTAGIDGHGALLVRVAGRIERVVGGEVLWH